MNDKQIIEEIIRNIAASFTCEQSTRDWTEETIIKNANPSFSYGMVRELNPSGSD